MAVTRSPSSSTPAVRRSRSTRSSPRSWLPQFGDVQGTFSGGQNAEVQQTRIDSLALGDWTVKNLPAITIALRQLSESFGVKRIDGILGTTLFYHFLTT